MVNDVCQLLAECYCYCVEDVMVKILHFGESRDDFILAGGGSSVIEEYF